MCTRQVQAQSAGRQYSLGFYQPMSDSSSYHSSMRDYMVQPVFALPEDTARKEAGGIVSSSRSTCWSFQEMILNFMPASCLISR